ncbi:hypothetical protein CYY_007399 [Polysphondylium violaceum]|uniref:F-actin binding domain-containing protein n=1 Tax=Polysphondylium violaceum TaxID=133409 RepID=A0A8J4PNS1_9MYCE|nr:hypothetical protein CYY_007399 [Polysphondylium violaceum]
MAEFKKQVKDISVKFEDSLLYLIDNQIINNDLDDDDDDDDQEEQQVINPLEYKIQPVNTPKERFIELIQKATKSINSLSSSIDKNERSNMIYATRDISTHFTQINEEATRICRNVPEGKAKEKFLENTSKLKTSSVQMKINISVKASSDESDDVNELNSKIIGLLELMEQCFEVVTHSDRIYNDMDFASDTSFSTSGGWNTVS